jgi:eukaryotic-like serine/threonine-protein kinase
MPIDKVLLKRYKVIKAIGGGAFGNTYLAIDTAFPGEPHRVVKHLCPQNDEPKNVEIAKRLFKTEAECLAKLGENDQIPRLFSYFEEDGEFYLVQELVEGHTLTQEFEPGKRWSEAKTVKFLQELLSILSVVHQQDTIHRDLKPANIMRRQQDGKLVLIDFGAVKEILTIQQSEQTSEPPTVGIGSGAYMPPEQGMGRPGKHSDVYAVGILGIQALTGLPPDELPHDSEHLEQMCNDLNVEVSSQLKYVLGRMVNFQYEQRFADAAEALKALIPTEIEPSEDKSTSSEPRTAKERLPTGYASRSPSPRKFLSTALGIIGIAGVGILSFAFINKPNYAQLETYLQNKQWQQADAETDKLLLKIAGEKSALDAQSSQQISCKSLQKIDRLWLENSDGRFGFTPQKEAYLATGNDFDDYVESTYEAFGDRLSWRIFGSWKRYQDFNFPKIDTGMTPSGFLPSPGKVATDQQDLRIREREMLLSRFDACGL